MTTKIQDYHLNLPAYIYLRQSTMGQVHHHRESTERQYALKDKAHALGWSQEKIKVLDGDLGISGTQATNREDFKILVADVSMSKVGAVFALEASRLSRSCTDWHRLLELCSLTNTLIIDEDGCYNPADFNDQLLLGLKGTMSQAELHFIRARLQGGKLNKAKKGELRFPLPVGFCYDDEGALIKDPDEEVRGAVSLVFEAFKKTGSAFGVVQYFAKNALKFPRRAYGGLWKGKLVWGTLVHGRTSAILKNPSYAGTYVYGRYKYKKHILDNGTIRSAMHVMPMSQWEVSIKSHHDAYISWETYLENQKKLQQNRTNTADTMLPGPSREGLALLQGILICGVCGHRLYLRYTGNGGVYPCYQCTWRKRDGLCSNYCMSIRCSLIDTIIVQRALAILKPAQIEIAVKAVEELQKRNSTLDKQWQMKIERANYTAQLAQRRYEEVDPSNRLVAATLEKKWNDALDELDKIRQEYKKFQNTNISAVTAENREKLLTLAKDFPRLWNAKTTKAKDRKRMLRLLIKDITVKKEIGSKSGTLHIRWQGGAIEDIPFTTPPPIYDQYRYSDEIINKVRTMALSFNNHQIAESLNREGKKPSKGNQFTNKHIQWIRYTYKIPAIQVGINETTFNKPTVGGAL
jgi:DNA invertase Pin-like site-specific DNA recombinase